MKHFLKLCTFLIFFCTNCFVVQAQQKHFIYVQSEDRQPFAVVLGGKVFSSSDYGYVIIPRLNDSTYNFTVSFPMNKFPDQYFTCKINKKDAGFVLKNQTNGWVLQNMQTQKFVVNNTASTEQKNAFGNMLSDVVSDSTLTKKNAVASNTVTATETAAANAISPTDSAQPQKIAESKLDSGTNMLFVDKTTNGTDTIHVFVPAATAATTDQNTTVVNADAQNENQNTAAITLIFKCRFFSFK